MACKSILVPLAAPVLDHRFIRGSNTGKEEDYIPQSASVILVRKDSPFYKFHELCQNSIFAYNDKNSLSGYHCMRFHIHMNSYKIPFFNECIETGGHSNSLNALLCKQADVACIDVDVLRRLRKHRLWRIKLMDLRTIEDVVELGPYPAQPFVMPLRYFHRESSSSPSTTPPLPLQTPSVRDISLNQKNILSTSSNAEGILSNSSNNNNSSDNNNNSSNMDKVSPMSIGLRFQEALCSATLKELKPLGWKRIIKVEPSTYALIDQLLKECKARKEDILSYKYMKLDLSTMNNNDNNNGNNSGNQNSQYVGSKMKTDNTYLRRSKRRKDNSNSSNINDDSEHKLKRAKC